MRAGNLLRQLDQRLLPPLTRAVARLGDRPTRSGVLTWAAALSAAAVLGTALWAADETPSGDPTVGEVTRVGVTDGDSAPGYLRSAAADLAALSSQSAPGTADGTYALVTLDAYLPPQRLAMVLGDVPVSTVFGRVPLPGRQTEIVKIPALRVPDDVVAGMDQVASRKETEAADYRARAAAVDGDGASERELRARYASGAEVAAAEAAAYRTGCACVYAAVVRAAPVVLRGMAARPDVRAVDPAPEVYRLDRTVFTPPLPEQRDVVRPPADTGPTPESAPAERSEPAPGLPAPLASVGESSEPAPVVTIPLPEPSSPEPTEPPPPSVTTSPDVAIAVEPPTPTSS
ncbi:hypothetical protein AB0B86_18500 [Micromonospora sp. NPDC049047]|uniref:hypothetical protein n=1 Tax=Micromonospora sp. NPDC049047 TaxID=3155645 RepID=UPI0034114445